MRFNACLIVICIITLLPLVMSAQHEDFIKPDNIDLVKEKLLIHAEETATIESNFIQEKHLWMLNEVLVSEGVFLFKKENNVRWQYNTPIEYTILIHDGIFTIVNNDKSTEFEIDSNPLFYEINSMIVTAIRGDFIDIDDFKTEFYESNNNYLAKLIPTNGNVSSMLVSIDIYFNKKSIDVEKIIFFEPGDDYTLITFIDKRVNVEIADDRFLLEEK
jgi:outer membrane lipoprotein-sorting protein